jgi:hypothetical protein
VVGGDTPGVRSANAHAHAPAARRFVTQARPQRVANPPITEVGGSVYQAGVRYPRAHAPAALTQFTVGPLRGRPHARPGAGPVRGRPSDPPGPAPLRGRPSDPPAIRAGIG